MQLDLLSVDLVQVAARQAPILTATKDLRDGQYNFMDLRDGQYNFKDLRDGQYNFKDLRDGQYNFMDLRDGQYNFMDLSSQWLWLLWNRARCVEASSLNPRLLHSS